MERLERIGVPGLEICFVMKPMGAETVQREDTSGKSEEGLGSSDFEFRRATKPGITCRT